MANKQYNVISAASNNAAVINAVPSRVTCIQAYNASAGLRVIKLYNKVAAPVPASDATLGVLIAVIHIPSGQSKEINFTIDGMQFTAGLGIAITGAAPLNDNTSVSAADVIAHIIYQDLA